MEKLIRPIELFDEELDLVAGGTGHSGCGCGSENNGGQGIGNVGFLNDNNVNATLQIGFVNANSTNQS